MRAADAAYSGFPIDRSRISSRRVPAFVLQAAPRILESPHCLQRRTGIQRPEAADTPGVRQH